MKLFTLKLQYAYCKTQAYLASQRGDGIAMVNWQQKAYEYDRMMDWLGIQ